MSNHQKPILIIIRGIPGSGKSYFANKLNKALKDHDCIVLDPDATNYKSKEYLNHVERQIKEGVDEKLYPYRFLRAKAVKGIEDGKIILWNQPFTDLKIMKKVTDKLEEFASKMKATLPIIIVEIEVSKKIAWGRILKRKKQGGHGPSENHFNKFILDYKSSKEVGYNTLTVNGEASPNSYIKLVVDEINKFRSLK